MAGSKSFFALLTGFGLLLTAVPMAAAAQPPAAVLELVSRVDRAANAKQLSGLGENFAPSYVVDGMSLSEWQKSLGTFWKRYPNLRYRTTIQAWRPDANGGSLDTMTQIDGSNVQNGKTIKLTAKIQSRQRIANGKIAQQEILSENIVATSGSKPPTVELRVPDKIRTNADYNIEAIVQEPLGDDVMMGTVTERAVNGNAYNKSDAFNLELLSTGGLFKDTKAPGKSGDYWLSVTFVRPDGMTSVTRRIHVLRRT
jgi:hypothetical protein